LATSEILDISTIDITKSELYPILDVLDISVLITNIVGEIIYYNTAHAKMDGLLSKTVLGAKVTDVYDLDENSSLVMRCLRTRRPIKECPAIYKTRKGHIVDSIHDVYPICKNGKIIGVISCVKNYQKVKIKQQNDDKKASNQTFPGDTDYSLNDIIGNSPTLHNAISIVRMAAKTDSPVLICGETGTGKELFAQSIHNLSNRKNAHYIAVNCAAIPDNLLEGILFGTSKGAFTGALDKPGLFERANGGTLFLDELNSMSIELQPKLLRVIQEKRVCRVGSHDEVKLDFKIISSTNILPTKAVEDGKLRSDLMYRVGVVNITLPALRKRKDDLLILTNHFISKYNLKLKKNVLGVSSEIKQLFDEYDWPGNVRELENTIEGAFNMVSKNKTIETWHLTCGFQELKNKDRTLADNSEDILNESMVSVNLDSDLQDRLSTPVKKPDLPSNIRNKERLEMIEALSDADANITDAAVILGVSRQTLYRKMKALSIKVPKKNKSKEREIIINSLQQYRGNITNAAKKMGISRQLLAYRIKKMGIEW